MTPFKIRSWIPSISFLTTLGVLTGGTQPVAAHADKGLTLLDLKREIGSAPTLALKQSEAEAASWNRVGSYARFLPSLSFSGLYLLDKQYALFDVALPGMPHAASIPQIIPSSVFGLSAQWTLFDGFRNVDTFGAAVALESAARNEVNWTQFQLERQVTLAFFQTLGAQKLEQVARSNRQTLEEHLQEITYSRQSGISTRFDVLRVEAQWSDAETQLNLALDRTLAAREHLGDLLGLRLDHRPLDGELPSWSAQLLGDKTLTPADRGDLKALSHRVQGTRALSSAAKKHWIPQLGLNAQVQQYNNRNNALTDSSAYRTSYTAGVQVSWNLFDGLASLAQDRQLREQHLQAEHQLDIQTIRAENAIAAWRRKFLTQTRLIHSKSNDVTRASESVRLAKEGRRVGNTLNSDLLDAELDLFRAHAGVIQAQLDALEALVQLELATGQRLAEFETAGDPQA